MRDLGLGRRWMTCEVMFDGQIARAVEGSKAVVLSNQVVILSSVHF